VFLAASRERRRQRVALLVFLHQTVDFGVRDLGDAYELVNQIRWYDDDFSQGVNTTGRIEAGEAVDGVIEIGGDEDWFEIEMEVVSREWWKLAGGVISG
jgi:hypothetical protein